MSNKYKELMRESAATEAEALVAAKTQTTTKKSASPKEPVQKEPKVAKPPKEQQTKKKNPGGRPKNADRGLVCRKQYTLTLEETTYQAFLERARKEKLSFAKFMEKAAYEYIENNK